MTLPILHNTRCIDNYCDIHIVISEMVSAHEIEPYSC
jgi:hypothetical protein